jgi:hypothetical protein
MVAHASDRVWHIEIEELPAGSWEVLMTEVSIAEKHCCTEPTNGW